jgi:uncharacterized membrane protein
MVVRYPGHWLKTRQQAMWQAVVLLLVLLPLAAWRASTQPLNIAIALVMLTLAPFAIAYQAWRFLEVQEQQHEQPTPEMIFVFRLIANTPLTFGALMFVLLLSLR